MRARAPTRTRAHTRARASPHAHAHTHARTCAPARTHARTHARARAHVLSHNATPCTRHIYTRSTPVYRNSGCVEIEATAITTPQPLYNATAYHFCCNLIDIPKELPASFLEIKGTSSTGAPSVVLRTKYSATTVTAEFTATFEGTGGIDSPLTITHTSLATTTTTLREMALPGYRTSFRAVLPNRTSIPHIPSKVCIGALVVSKCHALHANVTGFMFDIKAVGLPRSDTLTGLSDPFLRLTRVDTGAVVHQSEVHAQDLAPSFARFGARVCACGGMDAPLRAAVLDWDGESAPPDLLGACATSLRALVARDELVLVNEDKRSTLTNYSNSGTLSVVAVEAIVSLEPPCPPHCIAQLQTLPVVQQS
eukprot:TRINITY_DN1918_c0_g1_i1.p2 TRINITY_DN1918_c0_g1~~TRINITY_DN1918_c0_g1_i1.p2  ORF type:complete len:366 (-),score=69.83 TRINITY_DN1918_c0_g1_i1:65-1162(-)